MLTNHPERRSHGETAAPWWIDLVDPSEDERATVERAVGVRLPTRDDLVEIESSSRVSETDGALLMNMPAVSHLSGLDEPPSPVGFVLTPRMLVTIRYAELRSFAMVAERFGGADAPASSVDTFAALVEALVDVSADLLEGIAAELDAVSRSVFSSLGRKAIASRTNDDLRQTLTTVGRAGAQLGRLRDSLLGLHRIVPFVTKIRRDWIADGARERFETSDADVVSLNEYHARLAESVQFLLDAVLGFITTKQNDIFQMLTVISIVGIPPTLIASIYGMNFKNMPELSWTYGYPYALTLIVLSAVLPVLWFKWRKWI